MKTIATIFNNLLRHETLRPILHVDEEQGKIISGRSVKKFAKKFCFRFALILCVTVFFPLHSVYAQCGYNYRAHQSRNAQLQKKAEKKMKRAKGDMVNFSCVSETKSRASLRMKKRIGRQQARK
jgi:hypothetical protein